MEGNQGAEKARDQVLGKGIMFYFLLLSDFQKRRPRLVHKIYTPKWVRL